MSVPAGTVRRIPLGLHQRATLEARPTRSFDIGLGRPGQGGKTAVRGGTMGLIVDTRGRPLSLPGDEELRSERLQLWLRNLINDVDRTD